MTTDHKTENPEAPLKSLSESKRHLLLSAAERFGTPLYVYSADMVLERIAAVKSLFSGAFQISYAVKANPNPDLLCLMVPQLDAIDVSSYTEFERAIAAGAKPAQISFSGPAKKDEELRRAILAGCGDLIIETLGEARRASAIAATEGLVQSVLLRINPATVPKYFGVNMSGKASQFGVDEEEMDTAIHEIISLPGLKLEGFHIYSGSNCLVAEAIAENYAIFVDIFERASEMANIAPRRLIFGAGFGIPYVRNEQPLDTTALPALVQPILDRIASNPRLAKAELVLEMGRWLVGEAGWLLSEVVAEKYSRGTEIRLLDAGFNTHLAAAGMMGSVIRRNWHYLNLSNPDGEIEKVNLVGPLCTTVDTLATNLSLPALRVGDIIAIPQSGAYGLTASPTGFISHPEPREILMEGGQMRDISGERRNLWSQ